MIRFTFIVSLLVLILFSTSKSYAQISLEIDKTLIADFSAEEHAITFDKDFLTIKMDNVSLALYQSDGKWLLYPAGVIVIVMVVSVGLYGILVGGIISTVPSKSSDVTQGRLIMASGVLIGAGIVYLGSYIYRQGGPRKEKLTSKQKQLRDIKRFEDF